MSKAETVREIFKGAEEIPPAGDVAPHPDPFGPDGPPPLPEEEPLEAACALYPLNDYGNGLRFTAYYGEDCLFAPRVGWHSWTGKVWRLDEDRLEVRALAQRVSERILEEVPFVALEEHERRAIEAAEPAVDERAALALKDEVTAAEKKRARELDRILEEAAEARKALGVRKRSHRSHAKASGNTGAINNMLTEAQVKRAVSIARMNDDPLMINTLSGVVRIRQAVDPHAAEWGDATPVWGYEILPHSRDQNISKIMPVEIDPEAACPTFDAFLCRIQPDPEIREFLQRWFGYTLTGLTAEQKLTFFYGVGRNGKSTLVDCIAEIMADYATTVPIESLTGSEQRKGSDATPDLVRIPGARMVRASEPEQGQRMKEALIKALTGGEPILIRRMMQEFVEVKPEFKLTIQGNHKPEIRGGDDGIWRRVALVPFAEQIPVEEVDPLLPAKLRAERSGIFNWLLAGCVKYMADGLREPASVTEATRLYREESDPVRLFLLEECEITGSDADFVISRELVEAFRIWLEDRGDEPWGKRQASLQIRARAGAFKHPETGATYAPLKRSDTGYIGIRFRPAIAARLAERRNQWPGEVR
ncbi:phage/plasmid primase, P4 family [Defluviimonas sp. D31]|uniref:DNA primase family protein n=1 Tax=Defluviimonas sp. D31 TaxID=3083253 RepID=UPI00296FCAE1|nr:phage/plasmid primase, P4 family [Defluviimonas sp. D31]MDW4550869.1 phage/plasmid primase, P4 family [Defluviimonas sp. D31]